MKEDQGRPMDLVGRDVEALEAPAGGTDETGLGRHESLSKNPPQRRGGAEEKPWKDSG